MPSARASKVEREEARSGSGEKAHEEWPQFWFAAGLAVLGADCGFAFWRFCAAGNADMTKQSVLFGSLVLVDIFFSPALLSPVAFRRSPVRGQVVFLFLQGVFLAETVFWMPYVETAIHSDALGGLVLWIVSASHLVTLLGALFVFRREIRPPPPALLPAGSGP